VDEGHRERNSDGLAPRKVGETHRACSGRMLATRRGLLGSMAAFAGAAWAGLPWRATAQPVVPSSAPLIRIEELRSQNSRLQGTLSTRSREAVFGDADAGVPAANRGFRYFQAADSTGKVIWPPTTATSPLPGPTLRARIGERIELTFLNHVDVRDFAATGIDNAEKGVAGGCDILKLDSPSTILYPDAAGDSSPNCFHGSSTTNMHFHGTHVTPDGLGDNVLLQLRPDSNVTEQSVRDAFKQIFANGPPAKWMDLPETWRKRQEDLLKDYDRNAIWNGVKGALPPEHQLWPPTEKRINEGLWPQYQIGVYPYCFDLPKYSEDAQGNPIGFQMGQCPGTHWYHAHKHGSTAINVMNGMVGAFIIEGDYDTALQAIYPGLRTPDGKTEKVLVVHNRNDSPNMPRGNIHHGRFSSPTLLVNGQRNPLIVMQPGEIQLWRMVNSSVKALLTIDRFTSAAGGTPPEIRQIAQDGVQFKYENYVEQPILNYLKTGQCRPAAFSPGNRMDLLVQAPSSGEFTLQVVDTTAGSSPLLTVRVEGTPMADQFPIQANYPAFLPFLKDIKDADLNQTGRPPLNFGWEPGRPNQGPIDGKAPQFMINGKQFKGENYDQTMTLDAVEEWTLENTTSGIAHPFHIHVNPFQVVEIYDPNLPEGQKKYTSPGNHIWQDVIAIPPSILEKDSSGKVIVKDKGYVKIRHRFVDFAGSYVLHCHMLAHEDRGMMQLVRVIRKEDVGKPATPVPHH
jgi:FtsP/CotA-like multicopper oxidase with cupredoxin domain